MGFTGKEALAWKVRYIEAFNAMEADLLSRRNGEALAAARLEAAMRLAGPRAARADTALILLEEGLSQTECGRLLQVSRHVVYRLKTRFGFLTPLNIIK